MSQDPTPELTMLDSFLSTPESNSCNILPYPATSTSSTSALTRESSIDPRFTNMLSIFVDNIFENDPHSQAYLANLTDSEKTELKSKIVSSRSFIMNVQSENTNNSLRAAPTLLILPETDEQDPDLGGDTDIEDEDESPAGKQSWAGSAFHLTQSEWDILQPGGNLNPNTPVSQPDFLSSSFFNFEGSGLDPIADSEGLPQTTEEWTELLESMFQELKAEHGYGGMDAKDVQQEEVLAT